MPSLVYQLVAAQVPFPVPSSQDWINDWWSWFEKTAISFASWLSQPHILAIIIAWAVTFTVVCSIVLCLGFGPIGVGAGTLAAVFQSCMYGGFTPAGGIFATLTSMAMLGTMMPAAAFLASIIATGVAVIVWACGAGR